LTNLLEDIRDFNPIEYFFGHWQALQSSNLSAYRYNEGEKKLEIKFTSGRIYQFENVPKDIVDGLSTAASPGKYFNAEIKNTYNARRH
jgi:hypothetical protein